MKWESSRTKIWDSGDVAVSEYLQAINDASRLSENLIKIYIVQILIRIAMVKLEEEFTHILARRNRPFEPECMSFRSSDVSTMDGISICSFEFGQNLVDESPSRYSSSTYSGELTIDLECCESYISVRKDALAECLFMLEVDNLSIGVGIVALTAQNSSFAKIKKWNQLMKNFTSVRKTAQLMNDCFYQRPIGFFEICGEAIIDTKVRDPETVLFMKLDMYEVLLDLLPDIDNMFLEEAGSSVRFVFREVLKRFGDSVSGTFLEFEKAVGSLISTKPFTGGGISLLSKNVMHYIACLARDTLNMVLEVSHGHGGELLEEKENEGDHLQMYTHLLTILTEYRGYAVAYEKATWCPILNLLSEEGMCIPGSYSVSKRVLKERLKNFNLSFEKVYKSQTAWLIPPTQLREELQISISIKVLQAYALFLGGMKEILMLLLLPSTSNTIQMG
ncbi:hypothetical protein MKX01_029682 [Papaver californicum]|nr:hypothetical protein MKX01_029682 [Papaver californicum]